MANDRHSANTRAAHQAIVDEILADWPEAKPYGFMKALSTLPDADYMQSMHRVDREWWRSVSFIPDAYLIDVEERHVVVFEAIVTSDISQEKFAKMADMAWALDEDRYTLALIRCDRFGRVAYDVQSASLFGMLDKVEKGERPTDFEMPGWEKYTAKYAQESVGEAA